MTSTVMSAVLSGVTAIPVEVQVQIAPGLPSFNIVGMPDIAVAESKERVRAAFKSTGLAIPAKRVTVNLAPAHVRKTGSGLDLPIAVALMIASGHLSGEVTDGSVVVGELSLSGEVKVAPGIVGVAILAHEGGFKLITGAIGAIHTLFHAQTRQISNLNDLFNTESFSAENSTSESERQEFASDFELDYSDVVNQEAATRALTIAAAGNHNLLMIGEPGTGKTMLARRLPTILNDLKDDELLEVAQIFSTVDPDWRPIRRRPFRSPHHSASSVGLIGGGSPIRPGEVTFAHNGILFLDEIAEFKPATLQMLRQPMETGSVTIVRATESVRMPARFQLIATANPCPCGYFGSSERTCRCTAQRIGQYRSRLGGPLLDRIDMTIVVPRPRPDAMIAQRGINSSARLKCDVARAQAFALSRLSKLTVSHVLRDYLRTNQFSAQALKILSVAADAMLLSGRSLGKVCMVARTIADLEQAQKVSVEHVAEAMDYRNHWTGDPLGEHMRRS